MPQENETQQNFKSLMRLLDTKNTADKLLEAFGAIVKALTSLKSETIQEQETLKQSVKDALATLELAIASIKNGIDGKDGAPGKDGRDGIDGAQGPKGEDGKDGKDGQNGKDAPFDTAEDVRNKLELLQGNERLDKSAIKGLDEEFQRVAATRGQGGGISQIALQMAMAKLIKHEVHATTSATTTITLSDRVAHNTVIWAYYNGQLMSLGQQYTVSGNTVTPAFTLDNDSEWEFTFFRG